MCCTQLSAIDFEVFSRFNYYTNEDSISIMVINNGSSSLDCHIFYDTKNIYQNIPQNSSKEILLDSDDFVYGNTLINYKIDSLATDIIEIKKLTYRKNEVKIDRFLGGVLKGGKHIFPFGFYSYFPVKKGLIEAEAINRFNLISPYQNILKDDFEERKRYLDLAHKYGMQVNYNLLSVCGGGGVNSARGKEYSRDELDEILIDEINRVKNHPALLSWYISDEPVLNGKDPQELERLYSLIKKVDPYHPITMVFMHSHKAENFANAMDIVMADPYPIPSQKVTKVGRVTARLKRKFDNKLPVWIVPQAFGGNEWWEREPTANELRFMTYSAIINGATGIQYFVRKNPNGFPKSIKTWNEAENIAHEVGAITPYLFSDEKISQTKINDKSIINRTYKKDNEILIIVANSSPQPKEIQMELPAIIQEGELFLLNENRSINIDKQTSGDMIGSFGVNIYRFRSEADSTSILSNNLIKDSGFENSVTPGVPNHCYAYLGSDVSSNYYIDSQTAFEGNYSLKLITPTYYKGPRMNFHRIKLKPETDYVVSVMAKGIALNLPKEKKHFWQFWKWFDSEPEKKFIFELQVSNLVENNFELTEDWQEYKLEFNSGKKTSSLARVNTYLELIGTGKAWFDNLQVYPKQK